MVEDPDKRTSASQGASILNVTNDANTGQMQVVNPNRLVIAIIVYLALFIDNVLLTMIVPILPDYLASLNNRTQFGSLHPADIAAIGSSGIGNISSQHNLAYRYTDSGLLPIQSFITKHPIPGKSMVNFSLLHMSYDDKVIKLSPPGNIVNVSDHENGTRNSSGSEKLTSQGSESAQRITSLPTKTTMSTEYSDSLSSENGSIGILLAMKALVQLIFNPIVGNMSNKFGYRLPIVLGTFFLLVSSVVFAIGESYFTLLVARAIQGIGSACIGVCGMSLVAQLYPEEERRSKIMGIILGSIALGVLLGYPFGGISYDLIGKSAPFIILCSIIFFNLGLQLLAMDLSVQPEVTVHQGNDHGGTQWRPLLRSKIILAIVIAIWFSTSTMAILEPTLPIWLMQYLRPNKWQLGTVFIPDSLGYFVGTNFFGSIAYKWGQIKISCISLLLVGISSIIIPSATTISQLFLPHFALGLGIGVIDAALVPLLASYVDAIITTQARNDENFVETGEGMTSGSGYGTVYAVQQTSVSLAYFLAPLIGGELAQAFGFSWLMRIVGFCNIAYGPILVYLYEQNNPKVSVEKRDEMLLTNSGSGGSQYKKLYNSIDLE